MQEDHNTIYGKVAVEEGKNLSDIRLKSPKKSQKNLELGRKDGSVVHDGEFNENYQEDERSVKEASLTPLKSSKIVPHIESNVDGSGILLNSPMPINENMSIGDNSQIPNVQDGLNSKGHNGLTLFLFYFYNQSTYLYSIFAMSLISGLSYDNKNEDDLNSMLKLSGFFVYYTTGLVIFGFTLVAGDELFSYKQSLWTLSIFIEKTKERNLLKVIFLITSLIVIGLQSGAYGSCLSTYAFDERCKDVSSPWLFSFTMISTLISIYNILTYDAWCFTEIPKMHKILKHIRLPCSYFGIPKFWTSSSDVGSSLQHMLSLFNTSVRGSTQADALLHFEYLKSFYSHLPWDFLDHGELNCAHLLSLHQAFDRIIPSQEPFVFFEFTIQQSQAQDFATRMYLHANDLYDFPIVIDYKALQEDDNVKLQCFFRAVEPKISKPAFIMLTISRVLSFPFLFMFHIFSFMWRCVMGDQYESEYDLKFTKEYFLLLAKDFQFDIEAKTCVPLTYHCPGSYQRLADIQL